MYNIFYYEDKNGNCDIEEYLNELSEKDDKDSRIKLNKIMQYVNVLAEKGTRIGEPYIKHLDGDIWELRPLRDRIMFVGWYNNSFVLLHHFMKKTQRTPKKEIEKAKKELQDMIDRGIDYE